MGVWSRLWSFQVPNAHSAASRPGRTEHARRRDPARPQRPLGESRRSFTQAPPCYPNAALHQATVTGRDATGYIAGGLGLLVDGGRGPRERALGVKLAYERTEISGPVTERPQARHANIGSSSRPQSWMKVSSV